MCQLHLEDLLFVTSATEKSLDHESVIARHPVFENEKGVIVSTPKSPQIQETLQLPGLPLLFFLLPNLPAPRWSPSSVLPWNIGRVANSDGVGCAQKLSDTT